MKTQIIVFALGLGAAAQAGQTRSFEGVDRQGERCYLELTLDDDGGLAAIHHAGTYTAHYKIPTPGSGLYGDYRWEGEFTMAANTDGSGLKVRKRLLLGGIEITARGKPIFWDVPLSTHEFVLTGDFANPGKLTYRERAPLPGSLMVEVKADCQDLEPTAR